LNQNKETTTTQKATTRKSPSQTCVSPAEKAKQNQKNTKTQKRGQSPNKNTHRIDLQLEAVENPLHPYQKHADKNELCVAAVQADMKTLLGG